MFNSLFHSSISFSELLVRVVVIYAFILFLLRISGKRQLGQLSAIEFVSILLISNAVQNSMNGGDNSLLGGMILAGGLILLSTFVSVLSYKFTQFRHLVEGSPTLIVRKGEWIKENLRKERLTFEDVMTMLRRQGIHHVREVDIGILESDGSLSVTRVADAAATATSKSTSG